MGIIKFHRVLCVLQLAVAFNYRSLLFNDVEPYEESLIQS